ncbi:hypothetical protein [Corynebacterium cystitidis]|uniref:hypothetical protein n=1 Tax=Corynebacterium cystitidis TaxID=35757 RepID=UPI00211DCA88|nr:hypothetical protein [Corynebacterium cystitidis]
MLKNLHDKFAPVIERLFAQYSPADIRITMRRVLAPYLKQYADLIPRGIRQAVDDGELSGLSVKCETFRDQLDHTAAEREESGATALELQRFEHTGIILEAISYLDSQRFSKESLFNFFYCMGVFDSDDRLIEQFENPARTRG